MPNGLSTPKLTTLPAGTRVGAYADLRGAARAVRHLQWRGMRPDSLQVRPCRVRSFDRALVPLPSEPRRRVGVGGGVLVAATSVLVLGQGAGDVLAATVVGLIGGCIAFLLDDLVLRWRTRRATTAATSLHVGYFEVLCSRDAGAAEHELARWWDPAAPPVPVEPSQSPPQRPLRVLTAA